MIVTSKFLTGKNDRSPLSGPQHKAVRAVHCLKSTNFDTSKVFVFDYRFFFFSARERTEFNKSCNLIGSWSGRNFVIRTATAVRIHRVDLFS